MSASLSDVVPSVSVEAVGDSVLEWTEMNIKPVAYTDNKDVIRKNALKKLLSKVGI